MNDTLVGIVAHANVEEYWDDFEESLNNQSTSEFDCIVVMEDLKLSPKIKCSKLEIKEAPNDTSPITNRRVIADYAINHQYDNLIFLDADDYMYRNKIAVIRNGLKNSDLYVHNMRVVDQHRNVIVERFIGPSRINDIHLEYGMIVRKNFIGLGNTGFKTKVLLDALPFPENIIAIDWWIASCILLANREAIYDNRVLTDYRQYSGNLGVLVNFDLKKIEREILVKRAHYEALLNNLNPRSEYYDDLMNSLEKTRKLQDLIQTGRLSETELNAFKKDEMLVWWELSGLLEDKLWERNN